jgi:Phage terminase large subunit
MGYRQGILELKDALAGLERLPKSKQFVTSKFFGSAYVGGEGSSKTASLCLSAICNAWIDPGGKSLIGRLNMPALESTTMNDFLCMVPDGSGDWKEQPKTWTFSNGHTVIFRHLDITDPKVQGHIKSENLTAAYVDEASEVDEKVFLLLIGRLRRAGSSRRLLRLSSNPAGHDYMWKHFFDPQRKPEWKELFEGISSSSMDNVFLTSDYISIRKAVYPADWADRFIYGHFSDFTDLVYKEFSEDTHVWDDSYGCEYEVFGGRHNPPLDWPVIVGMDIGGGEEGDPWALTFDAIAPDARMYQFAEIYGSDLRIAPIAEQFHEIMQGRTLEGMAYDYAQRAAAIELEDPYGIYGQPAVKEVKPGLFKVAQYMHIDPTLIHPFNPRISGSPRNFMAKSCENSVREHGSYKWAKDRSGNAKNEPSHENSHSPDAKRYAIHTFRPLPARITQPKIYENPKLDIASRLYWHRVELQKEKQPVRVQGFSTFRLNQMRQKQQREIRPQ